MPSEPDRKDGELLSSGARAERYVERWLSRRGLNSVARNYRCGGGEIDLVMRDGEVLVFVEVRYRRSARFGSAAESVDHRKQQRLLHAARHFLSRNRAHATRSCRFDVVAVDGAPPATTVDWIRNAFSA